MPRPRIEIKQQDFEYLAEIQCTAEELAGFFHCNEITLRRYARKTYGRPLGDVLTDFRAGGRASLRRAQYLAAMNGNTQMLIFLGKQWLNQSDKIEQKTDGPEPARIVIYKADGRPGPGTDQTGGPAAENSICLYLPDDGREGPETEYE